MRVKLAKMVSLPFLGLLLLAMPLLGGCGAEEEGTVLVGFIGDFTGVASATCNELKKAIDDYLAMAQEENPIPGADIKLATYDTRMKYDRVPFGYQDLKGRGADIFFNFNPIMQGMLIEDHQEDHIPSLSMVSSPTYVGQDWIYSFGVHYPLEAEAIAHWIVKEWWPDQGEERAVKIGHVGIHGYGSTDQVSEKLQEMQASDDYDFELVEEEGLETTPEWGSEVSALSECDIIIVNCVGPQAASFVRDAKDRNYAGKLLGTSMAFLGFWELVKDAVSPAELDGTLAIHGHTLWTDKTDGELVPFMALVDNMLHTYRESEYDNLRKGTSYMTGVEVGMVLEEAIRNAAEDKTADQTWAEAINAAMQDIHIDKTADGFGEVWECHDINILHRQLRVIEYRYPEDDWYEIRSWELPPSLQSGG